MKFPKKINLKIIERDTSLPVSNIALKLTIYAKEKNNYRILLPVTDKNGEVFLAKEWIETEIEKHRNLFISDYSSNLEMCNDIVDIIIMDDEELKRAVEGSRNFKKALKYSIKFIRDLSNAKNDLFISKKVSIDVKTVKSNSQVTIELTKK